MTRQPRTFVDEPAVRRRVPILAGLFGVSNSGKTKSAIRLAVGMQRVVGGEIFGIDTESNRMLHYADEFKFRHVPFGAPFSPLDYLAVLEHCKSRGAKVVIVDSMSHEHEGPGGVMEMHASEVERLSGGDERKAERVKMLAWNAPKSQRRRLLNTITQMDMHVIFCFRAKEKLKIVPGKQPESMGFMPIAGEEFIYEQTVNFLLPPGARGLPTWEAESPEQRMFLKIPGQFDRILNPPRQLDEDIGEQLARWAEGLAGIASKNEIRELTGALVELGLETPEKRKAWIAEKVGRAEFSTDLKSTEIVAMLAAAKAEAEAKAA